MAAAYSKVALGPLQETMRIALGLTDNQLALLQGPALALPMLIGGVPLGLIVDRYSRVRLLFVLLVLILVGSVLTAKAGSFAALFAARSLVGFAVFAMVPPILSLLADLYPAAQRGRASMVMLIGQFAGWSATFAIGGMLVTKFGSGPDAWRTAMLTLTAPLLVVVILSMLALREPPRSGLAIQNPSTKVSLAEFWRFRALIAPVLGGKTLALIALAAIMIWTAPAFARAFALAPDRVGAIVAIAVPCGGLIGTIGGGLLADFCQRTGGPRRTVFVVSLLALLCVPAGLFAVVPQVGSASVLLVASIAILTAISVMAATLLIVVIPNEIRGVALGLLTGVGAFLSVGLSPLLVSSLSSVLGGPTALGKALAAVSVGGALLCAAVFAFGRRYVPRGLP